jgi:hypothetical protein
VAAVVELLTLGGVRAHVLNHHSPTRPEDSCMDCSHRRSVAHGEWFGWCLASGHVLRARISHGGHIWRGSLGVHMADDVHDARHDDSRWSSPCESPHCGLVIAPAAGCLHLLRRFRSGCIGDLWASCYQPSRQDIELMRPTPPNHTLQRTRPSHHYCNPRVSWAGSLSLGR